MVLCLESSDSLSYINNDMLIYSLLADAAETLKGHVNQNNKKKKLQSQLVNALS